MTDGTNPVEPVAYVVDAARLQHGVWGPRSEKALGEGDIVASYSADRIAMGRPVRKPFSWQGALWVCIGLDYRGGVTTAEAFRLTQAEVFSRKPVSYAEKTADVQRARADPNGFYHGMIVKHAGNSRVLCGPPALFVTGQPDEPEQMSLFGPAECSLR
jgi:hypothetical protein